MHSSGRIGSFHLAGSWLTVPSKRGIGSEQHFCLQRT